MATSKMKCLVKQREVPGYDFVEQNIPEPLEGELLVKCIKSSICGSDINLFAWNDVARKIAKVPFTPGHEGVSEIIKIGPNCPSEYKTGQTVCCENHFYCGKCYQCLNDQMHICQNLSQYGHGKGTVHGGFSEYSIIPARYAYILKTDLDPELACLLEPFGVSHQGVEKLEPKNETVLVQGCGPIGLYAISLCKYFGARKIIATDIVDERLQLAKGLGADVLINGLTENLHDRVLMETDGDGVGRLLEASGAQPLVNQSFKMLRKGGVVVLVGIPKKPLHVEDVIPDFLMKSLTLHTIHGRRIFHTWEKCEQILASKAIDIWSTISHRFGMSQWEKAFETLMSGKCCKIMIDPQA